MQLPETWRRSRRRGSVEAAASRLCSSQVRLGSAFLAESCWVSIAMLYDELGHKHFVATETEAGSYAALAATEVAFILQSGQARGLQFTITPESPATPVTPQHEIPQHEPQ